MTGPVRIPPGPFPDWAKTHRTLGEVARTDALLAKAEAGRQKFTRAEAGEFGRLMQKAYRNNPPSSESETAA